MLTNKPVAWLDTKTGLATADPTTKDRFLHGYNYIPLYQKRQLLKSLFVINSITYLKELLKELLIYSLVATPLLIIVDEVTANYRWETETNVMWGWFGGMIYIGLIRAIDKIRKSK